MVQGKKIEKISEKDQKLLAKWAADCADHVLLFFERANVDDDRPRVAIEAARAWAAGDIEFAEVKAAALGAQSAARVAEGSAARSAARASGHAALVSDDALHAPQAALFAQAAAQSMKISGEREWQYHHLPKHLRALPIFHTIK